MATDRQHLPPLGQPENDPTEPVVSDEPDFASEHEDTAVSKRITSGDDTDREPEAPEGWGGLDPERGPGVV
jgi:hypothetical protein